MSPDNKVVQELQYLHFWLLQILQNNIQEFIFASLSSKI